MAFEVVEHAVDPLGSFQDAFSFVAPKGALLFSTSLLSRKPDKEWFYSHLETAISQSIPMGACSV
jgi:hypothetical protein